MNHGDPWAELARPGGTSVWATIIAVDGHAYRKEGAAMVLHSDGGSAGVISPGCLEDDLQARVPAILASGLPELVVYDMRPEEDPVWGETIGCGGKITVLLEPLDGELLRLLREARARVEAGESIVLERRRAGRGISYRLAAEVPAGAGKTLGETAAGATEKSAGERLYAAVFRPKPRLIVFGAGRDAPPLCALGARIGFRVIVADWRQGLLSAERFPAAEDLVAGNPREVAGKLAVGPEDFAIVCSHQLRYDREILEMLLPVSPAYIGVMGSRSRVALLFEELRRTPNVHAPVGLDIGAEGPEEIAVSIAAELIAVKAVVAGRLKGVGADADRRFVLGGGTGQPNGREQAVR